MDIGTMAQAIRAAAREWQEDDKKRARPAKNIPANLKGRTFRLSPPEGGKASEGGEEAGDERKSHGNTRLPYGLCKKYGIEVPPGTTPYEAWELLKGKGVNPKEEYRKLKERGERAQKKAKREAEEKAKREAEERARREAEEQAKSEAEERAKREAEEKAKRETEEKARKEAGEKTGGETGAGDWPEPERLEPWKLRTAMDATAALEGRCGCPIDRSWTEGVCSPARRKIAGAIVALDGRYHALDAEHNRGFGVALEDGYSPDGSIAGMGGTHDDGSTLCLRFFKDSFCEPEDFARTEESTRAECRNGDKMPCAEGMETEYLAAHEYGHCVQQRLLRDTGVYGPEGGRMPPGESNADRSDAAAEAMREEILRIAREIEPESDPEKPIADGGCISEYGVADPYEFFAECFANSVCGKPNALGRAMAVFLSRSVAGDGSKENYRKAWKQGQETGAEARKKAEERAGRRAEEKARKEAEERARREASAAGSPEPERVEPKTFRTPREATEHLERHCNGVITDSWKKGVCEEAKMQIAGTVAALEERYGALDGEHNNGAPIGFWDGPGPKPDVIASAVHDKYRCTTQSLKFYSGYFGSPEALEAARTTVRGAKDAGTGYYMPSADGTEITYLAAHEYGHCVEFRVIREMMDARGGEGDTAVKEAARQIRKEILRIAREIEPESSPGKPIKDGGCISEYGRTNPYEFFAECFANSVCGKPNALGRAMAIYLSRHGIGRAGE